MTKVKQDGGFCMHFMRRQIVCVCIYVCACESSSSNNSKRDRAYIYDEGERGRESMEEAKKGSETR